MYDFHAKNAVVAQMQRRSKMTKLGLFHGLKWGVSPCLARGSLDLIQSGLAA
jgi:hypothetical protein